MNLFGADVRDMDVAGFLTTSRHLFPLLALVWLALLMAIRRAWWLTLGVVLANGYVWFETNWPLQRLYALGPSSDRLNNIALSQAVAAGHPILLSHQVGTFQIEPLWTVAVAAVSGWDSGRLLRIYAFLPLVAVTALAVSIYLALAPPRGEEGSGWSEWERALAAGAASLLCSAPLDHLGAYRVPWAMTFLLKPNHAAALAVLPWMLRRFATVRGDRDRLAAGGLLGLLGWIFPIPMAIACAGLILNAVAGRVLARETADRELRDAGAVVASGLLVVGPYALMLLLTYRGFQPGLSLQIPPSSPHLLEVLRAGWLFPLAVWGVVTSLRGRWMARLWAFQLMAGIAVWVAFYPLSFVHAAKERDDVYYWIRILLGIMGAIGAWDLAARAAARGHARMHDPAIRATLLAALAIPATVPYWWDPARMDPYFAGSIDPVPRAVMDAAAVLAQAPEEGIVAGDPALARWMAALTGRRVAFASSFPPPPELEKLLWFTPALLRADRAAAVEAKRLGVSHVIVDRAVLDAYGLTVEDIARHPYLRQVSLTRTADGDIVALYEIVHSGTGERLNGAARPRTGRSPTPGAPSRGGGPRPR